MMLFRQAVVPAIMGLGLALAPVGLTHSSPANYRKLAGLIKQLKWGNTGIRALAVERLYFLQDKRAVVPLLRMLSSNRLDWRIAASSVFARWPHPGGLRAAQRMLKDPEWEVRLNAATFLSNFRNAWVIRGLLRLYRDPVVQVRREAARALAEQGSQTALFALRTGLASSDLLMRALSARAIGRIKGKKSRQALRPFLKDPAEIVRLAVIESLARLEDPLGRKALQFKLKAKAPHERRQAVRILGNLTNGKWVKKALLLALMDKKCRVSVEAARSLVLLGNRQGEEKLLSYYMGDDRPCRKLAARAMTGLRMRGKWPHSKRCRAK